MEQTNTIHSVDTGFTYAFLSCHFPSNSVLILLDQWSLTFFTYLTLLSNKVTRFSTNTLNGGHLL